MAKLTYEQLKEAVEGDSPGLRATVELEPAGGPGDKVFPATYGVSDNAETKYSIEKRLIDGNEVDVVQLDSVASQANRMELSLLEAYDNGDVQFPVPYVDFSSIREEAGYEKLTVLEVPHRIFDAIFRDSLLDETLFRMSDIGREITEARPGSATAIYKYSPTSLLFGAWDSTGPKKLGSKFQRIIVSEISGYKALRGQSTASRIDPLGIKKNIGDKIRYEHKDRNKSWTFNKKDAALETSGKAIEIKKSSEINHGNIAPSIESRAGGVSIEYALQISVMSFPALRRLKFLIDCNGNEFKDRKASELIARTVIASLGLLALASQYELGYDLRSRCLLLPRTAPNIEILKRDKSFAPEQVEITPDSARQIFDSAKKEAEGHGLGWPEKEICLVPSEKFKQLILASGDMNASSDNSEE